MVTFSVAFDWAIVAISDCLLITLLVLAIRRNLYRRLASFTVYIVLLIAWDIVWLYVSHGSLYYQRVWFYIFWSAEFLLASLRLLTIAEISKRFLRGYPAIWAIASRLLIIITLILLGWTTHSAIQNIHHVRRFIIAGDQRFECTQAILLVLVLIIGVYYRLRIPHLYRLILIGIGMYSSIQVLATQIGLLHALTAFDYIRRATITVSIAIWTYAVWRWAAVPEPHIESIPQVTYDDLAPQVHDRLRDLNDKLADLTGRRRR